MHKIELVNMLKYAKDKRNLFCMKRHDFILDIDKIVTENMMNVLKNKVATIHFNKCNTMKFYDTSRNKEATSECN